MDGPPYYSTHYAVSPAQFSPANTPTPSRNAPTFSFNAQRSNATWRQSREEDAQNDSDADFPPPPPLEFDREQDLTMTTKHVANMHPANRLLLPARVAQPVTATATATATAQNANLPGPTPANALRYRVKTCPPNQQVQVSAKVSKNPLFHTVFTPANGFGDLRAFSSHYSQYAEVMDTLVQAELDRILRPTVRPNTKPPQTPSRTVSQPLKNAPATPSRTVPPLNVQQYPAQRASVQNGNQSPQLLTQNQLHTAPVTQNAPPMNAAVRNQQAPSQPIYAQPILLPQSASGQNSNYQYQSNGFHATNGVPQAPNHVNIASVAQSPRLMPGHRATAVAALPPTVPQSPNHSARAVSSSTFPSAPPPTVLPLPQNGIPQNNTQKFVPPTPPTRRTSIQNSQTFTNTASCTPPPSVANAQVTNGSSTPTQNYAATPLRIANGNSLNVTPTPTTTTTTTPARGAQMYNANANVNVNVNTNVTAAFADIDQMLTGLTAELDKMLDNEVVLRRKK